MADKKPGLFKRLFSFGQKEEPRAEEAVAPETISETPSVGEIPVEAAERAVETPVAFPDPPEAAAPETAEPETAPAVPTQAAPEPSAPRGKRAVMERRNRVAVEPAPAAPAAKAGWLARLTGGLSRTSTALTENVASVFTRKKLDETTLEDLEDVLIQADLGIETATRITGALSAQRLKRDIGEREVREVMAAEIEKVLEPVAQTLELDLDHRPHVILVVGVNGSGKTTTIGKLSAKLKAGGFSTLLVAGDTFRAAAIEQLKIWGERTGAPVVAREIGADAAGLAYDAWRQARDSNCDVMLMDTAGRLQNKAELMAELEKIVRVLKKQDPQAPHTVLLTLDATTGQNALNQVEIFGKTAGVNGLAMTKLDGTARGGILVAIAAKHKLPVWFIGVGEGVDDLEPFEARDFARSIAGLDERQQA